MNQVGMFLGWHAVEPAPAPLSPLLDTPPVASDLVAANRAWRTAVENDQRRLDAAYAQQPIWYPVPPADGAHVVPVLGGSADVWGKLVACAVTSAAGRDFDRVRVVNLAQVDVLDPLRRAASVGAAMTLRSDTLSAGGSTVDVFANLAPDELAGLVADVVRSASGGQGRNDATRAKQELLRVARLLDGPVGLSKLRDAVALALGHKSRSLPSSFTSHEERELRDYRADVVGRQPQVAARLSDLHSDLDALSAYAHDPARRPGRFGRTGPQVRTLSVEHSGGTQDRELACELLSRAAMRAFATPFAGRDLLVVVGAEALAAEVLSTLTGAAQRRGKRLVLVFNRITDLAETVLGHGGSDCAVFLRLSGHQDATRAADYLGREFSFVVNGFSIAEGETEQWSESHGTSTSGTTGTSRTSTSTRSLTNKALSLGHSFGTGVSESFTHGTNRGSTVGGTTQLTSTTSVSRQDDHVVRPAVFQGLEDDVMLVVRQRTVVLAFCDPAIAGSGLVSPTALEA